jgi:hypothetical protein
MQIKQSPAETLRNAQEVKNRIQKAGAKLVFFNWTPETASAGAKNAALIDEYMEKNFTTTDGVDYSADNIYRAICRLRDELSWTVAPKTPTNEKYTGLRNHAQNDDPGGQRAQQEARERAAKASDREYDGRVMKEVLNLIQDYNPGRSHAVNGRRKEALLQKVTELKKANASAGEIYTAVTLQIRRWD